MIKCPHCDKKLNWYLLHIARGDLKTFKIYKISTYKCYHCQSFIRAKNNNIALSMFVGVILFSISIILSSIYMNFFQGGALDVAILVTLCIVFVLTILLGYKWWNERFIVLEKEDMP